MANALVTVVLTHTCLRTKSNVHSDKEATRSESNPVAVTRMIKVLADGEKGRGKGKGKGKKESRSKSAGARGGDAAATETIHHSSTEV